MRNVSIRCLATAGTAALLLFVASAGRSPAQTLYVAVEGNNGSAVEVFTADGTGSALPGVTLAQDFALAFDAGGNLSLADE